MSMISLAPEASRRAAQVRRLLPLIPWAMLRISNEHSQAFRGRYSPENSPWGVEIAESQYWPHVRTVDVVGPPQIGKTYHGCELPTLYDLCESRETVFYMNGSADNALNVWSTRWLRTLRADPVLRLQLLDRMEAGRWEERHFADGGLLYSAGPESAVALSQKESRIVRCSELEKTKANLGNEASSYSLARDRAAAYPDRHMITSDCTVTVREGLSWIRFAQGDRSRPFIPCPHCGHYAVPAHERHLREPDLALTLDTVHLLEIPAMASAAPTAAEENSVLACKKCGGVFSNALLRQSIRAGVWCPVGAQVIRRDDPKVRPIPKVTWLDELVRWAYEQLADPRIVEGDAEPAAPPAWTGPRLPEGVELVFAGEGPNPLKNSARSFWLWRLLGTKYTIGGVAREIVESDLGKVTGDVIDDQKNATQKCFVLPYVETVLGDNEDLSEKAVLLTVCELPEKRRPENTARVTAGVDVNEDFVRAVKRAWTADGPAYLMATYEVSTGKHRARDEGRDFAATRTQAIFAALNRIWDEINAENAPDMTYVDSGFMSDEIYEWCGSKSFQRLRPCKGFGSPGLGARMRGSLAGMWNDACEKRALLCRGASGRPLKHQYYDADDPRRLMKLDADHWKKEIHNGIRIAALCAKARKLEKSDELLMLPWFFIHAGIRPDHPYVKQVVAERWEEWVNPRTGKTEKGWKEYYSDNHFLDAEAYACAAAAVMGVDIGRGAAPARPKPQRPMPRPQAGQRHDPSQG